MSMYDMVDTTPEGYSEGEELSKMFSEDDMSEAFEERDIKMDNPTEAEPVSYTHLTLPTT